MGLLRGLVGKNGGGNEPSKVSKPISSPEYQRINKWIESRIGNIDPADSGTKLKLENLLSEEKAKYPSARGKLVLTTSGNDTLVTGDSIRFKNRLRRLGGKWDAKLKRWVIKNKSLTEDEIDDPSELAGLKAYINTMQYRKKLGGQGSP
jgi:hypothetical protein